MLTAGLPVATAASHAVHMVGMPEGRIPLAQALPTSPPLQVQRFLHCHKQGPETSGAASFPRCRCIYATPPRA
jgi:hypothetical protein